MTNMTIALKQFATLLMSHPIEACITIIIIAGVFCLIYKDREDVLRKGALYAVSTAETEWKSKMGQVKFAQVYTWMRKKYPVVTFFLTENLLKKIIEDALEELKAILKEKEMAEEADGSNKEDDTESSDAKPPNE